MFHSDLKQIYLKKNPMTGSHSLIIDLSNDVISYILSSFKKNHIFSCNQTYCIGMVSVTSTSMKIRPPTAEVTPRNWPMCVQIVQYNTIFFFKNLKHSPQKMIIYDRLSIRR